MKAIWNDMVIAQSDQTMVIEGNHYFPRESVNMSMLSPVEGYTTTCSWKGVATYFDVVVGNEKLEKAGWTYVHPKAGSTEAAGGNFANYIAFWNGVEIVE
jgi:uncharacterized protein (DUF427 family)